MSTISRVIRLVNTKKKNQNWVCTAGFNDEFFIHYFQPRLKIISANNFELLIFTSHYPRQTGISKEEMHPMQTVTVISFNIHKNVTVEKNSRKFFFFSSWQFPYRLNDNKLFDSPLLNTTRIYSFTYIRDTAFNFLLANMTSVFEAKNRDDKYNNNTPTSIFPSFD